MPTFRSGTVDCIAVVSYFHSCQGMLEYEKVFFNAGKYVLVRLDHINYFLLVIVLEIIVRSTNFLFAR